jgi:prepilin-type N-terminal cleavage/methylation domain-containing protein
MMIKKGFTLVEILVVLFIMVVLAAVVMPNYRRGESELILLRAANKLAQNLRRAEEMAVSAKICDLCGGIVPPGYGVYLKQGEEDYLLYADDNPSDGNEKRDGGDTEIETISLEKGIFIKNVSPASLSINFRPPEPKVKISGSGVDDASLAIITLALKNDPTIEKIIKVNKAGLIYVE